MSTTEMHSIDITLTDLICECFIKTHVFHVTLILWPVAVCN